MEISGLRNYGVAFSDAEGSWPPALKRQMTRTGRAVVLGHLSIGQRFRFLWAFIRERRRLKRLDLTALRERGMRNESFLAQQIEYLALFAALNAILGSDRAVAILNEVMEKTAKEALLLCLPDADDLRRFDDPLAAFAAYSRLAPAAACKAGCNTLTITEDGPDAFQFDVTWCVWLELATLAGIPTACQPNCYADDLVFPDYFRALGIRYRRTSTLAYGARCCDFRFERMSAPSQSTDHPLP